MILLNLFKVSVSTPSGQEYAELSSATLDDLPDDWDFAWRELGEQVDPEYQALAKLVLNNECLGFIKFGLYPEPGNFKFVDIEQVEANPLSRGKMTGRLASPVGFWLLWYAIKTGLEYCDPNPGEPFVLVLSYEDAFDYYRDEVGMKYLGPVTISPTEDGYSFRFLTEEAKEFCQRIEFEYGIAQKQSI